MLEPAGLGFSPFGLHRPTPICIPREFEVHALAVNRTFEIGGLVPLGVFKEDVGFTVVELPQHPKPVLVTIDGVVVNSWHTRECLGAIGTG